MRRTILMTTLSFGLSLGVCPAATSNTSVKVVDENPTRTYFMVKGLLMDGLVRDRLYLDDDDPFPPQRVTEEAEVAEEDDETVAGGLILLDCGGSFKPVPWEYFEKRTLADAALLDSFAAIAANVIEVRYALTDIYPTSLWRPRLIEYERQQVDAAISSFRNRRFVEAAGPEAEDDESDVEESEGEEAEPDAEEPKESFPSEVLVQGLTRVLKRYRQEHPELRLPDIVPPDGCGDGGPTVEFGIDPPDGRVQVIPEFFFKLCQIQGIDPYDTARCDRWIDIANGTVSQVSGLYMFLATWPDGTQRRLRHTFVQLVKQPLIIRKK